MRHLKFLLQPYAHPGDCTQMGSCSGLKSCIKYSWLLSSGAQFKYLPWALPCLSPFRAPTKQGMNKLSFCWNCILLLELILLLPIQWNKGILHVFPYAWDVQNGWGHVPQHRNFPWRRWGTRAVSSAYAALSYLSRACSSMPFLCDEGAGTRQGLKPVCLSEYQWIGVLSPSAFTRRVGPLPMWLWKETLCFHTAWDRDASSHRWRMRCCLAQAQP